MSEIERGPVDPLLPNSTYKFVMKNLGTYYDDLKDGHNVEDVSAAALVGPVIGEPCSFSIYRFTTGTQATTTTRRSFTSCC